MIVSIKVLDWHKFNPRTDRNNFVWFRMQNTFFSDPKFFSQPDAVKILWVFLLCEASKFNNEAFLFDTSYASAVLGYDPDMVEKTLTKFINGRLVAAEDPAEAGALDGHYPLNGTTTIRYDTIRNETKEGRVEQKSGSGLNSPCADAPSLELVRDHRLKEIWNEHRGKLAKVRALSKQRQRLCELRWSDINKTDAETHWTEVVKKIASSPFCTGANERGWRATFDWLLKSDTQWRVLEGKYDGKLGIAPKGILDILADEERLGGTHG